jgi:hypothetical protein
MCRTATRRRSYSAGLLRRVPSQGSFAGFLRRVTPQGSSAGLLRRVTPQGSSAGFLRRVTPQGSFAGLRARRGAANPGRSRNECSKSCSVQSSAAETLRTRRRRFPRPIVRNKKTNSCAAAAAIRQQSRSPPETGDARQSLRATGDQSELPGCLVRTTRAVGPPTCDRPTRVHLYGGTARRPKVF